MAKRLFDFWVFDIICGWIAPPKGDT